MNGRTEQLNQTDPAYGNVTPGQGAASGSSRDNHEAVLRLPTDGNRQGDSSPNQDGLFRLR
jgi:hypothetical protein